MSLAAKFRFATNWRLTISLLLLIATASLLSVTEAPRYLAVAEARYPADVVVVFMGQDFEARQNEARALIEEGFADCIMLPAYGEIHCQGPGKELPYVYVKQVVKEIKATPIYIASEKWPYRMFESTHLEVILTREMMLRDGSRTALLVSSPYHMRRIKIIAERVLGRVGLRFWCIPNRFESIYPHSWWRHPKDIYWSFMEYLKIGWFYCYSTVFADKHSPLDSDIAAGHSPS